MRIKSIALGLAAAAALSVPASAADLVNGGFETGDLFGWSFSDGFVQAVTSADDAIVTPELGGEHFTPQEGAYFAQLTAGVDVGAYTTLSQTFTFGAGGGTVSGIAAFLAFDSDPYNDDGYVRILDAGTGALVASLFERDVADVGDFGHTHWTAFTSGLLGPGSYTLQAAVRNDPGDTDDNGASSQLLVDGLSIASAGAGVPEPASWTLMIAGFGGLGAALRARRRAVRPPDPGAG